MNRFLRPSLFLVAALLLGGSFSSSQTVFGQVIISEFRFRGTAGNDEFIEFYNNSDSPVTVTDTSPDGNANSADGWALVGTNAAGSSIVIRFVIPEGTVIPARGHFLAVNIAAGGYSLGTYAAGNQVFSTVTGGVIDTALDNGYATGVTDTGGIALFNTANPAQLPPTNTANPNPFRLDAVGSSDVTNTLFREGSGFVSPGTTSAANAQQSYVRRIANGLPQDTGANRDDFVFVTTTASDGVLLNGRQPVLGAPGPENLSSPIVRNATIKSRLLEPTLASSASPNRVRTGTGNSGTVSFRRTLRNNTGQTINSFRFRVNDLTTIGNDGGDTTRAQLALTDSIEFTYDPDDNPGTANTVALSTTLEEPATTTPGGGINASLRVNFPTGVTVASGSSFSVNITFNIIRTGAYRFSLNHEAVLEPIANTSASFNKEATTSSK